MRTMILIVILQLAVLLKETNGDEKYKFGDIIAFERGCICKGTVLYKHYAIFVGDEEFDGKKKENNIFEFTGTTETFAEKVKKVGPFMNCIFSTLKENSKHSPDNYLDEYEEYKPKNIEEIKDRIKQKYRDCGPYGLRENNCEHLATYVRYGVSIAVQHGTVAEGKCKNQDPNIKTNIKELLNKIVNNDYQNCNLVCPTQRGPG